jgi:NAD(P)H dehydrogenase (quinone)
MDHRYGEGALTGKRALVSVCTGGSEADYGPRGINGPIDQLLFPLTHGALFYPGMDVLPTHTVCAAAHFNTADQIEVAKAAWRSRVERLFEDAPFLSDCKMAVTTWIGVPLRTMFHRVGAD